MEVAQQSREAIEAAVRAVITAQFNKDIVGAVEAEKRCMDLVKQELLALQRTAEDLKRDGEIGVM